MAEVATDIASLGVPGDLAERFWDTVRENITVKADMAGWWDLFRDGPGTISVANEDREFVTKALSRLPEPPYDAETWATWTAAVKEATGRKGRGLFMPLRKAVTGRERGPEMADVMALMQVKPTLS